MALNPNGLGFQNKMLGNPFALGGGNPNSLAPNPNMGIMAMMATAVPQPAALGLLPSMVGATSSTDEAAGAAGAGGINGAGAVGASAVSGGAPNVSSSRRTSPQILTPAELNGGAASASAISISTSSVIRKPSFSRSVSTNLPLPSGEKGRKTSAPPTMALTAATPTTPTTPIEPAEASAAAAAEATTTATTTTVATSGVSHPPLRTTPSAASLASLLMGGQRKQQPLQEQQQQQQQQQQQEQSPEEGGGVGSLYDQGEKRTFL